MTRKTTAFFIMAGLSLVSYSTESSAQAVGFGTSQQTAPQQTVSQQSANTSTTSQPANPNAAPEKGYSQYYQAPGVWTENEDLPPEGIDAPPTPVPPAPGDSGSDAQTPVGNSSMAPTQGAPNPNADPNADNGGLMSAAAQPAAVSGVGSDHPGMN
ncbi:hypothetical protein FAI40_05960 [Acetobacteraceae bacterium]|nr:hypothetical protein FAI40_05960 [Acetobacteraceae bacterium]